MVTNEDKSPVPQAGAALSVMGSFGPMAGYVPFQGVLRISAKATFRAEPQAVQQTYLDY